MTNSEKLAELNAIGYVKLNGPQRAQKKALETLIVDGQAEAEFVEVDDQNTATDPVATPKAPIVPDDDLDEPDEQPPVAITISQEQLQAMIDRAVAAAGVTQQEKLDQLERQLGPGNWRKSIPDKKKVYTATIRKYREDTDKPWELVIDWKFMKNVYDEGTRRYNKQLYKVTFKNMETGELRVDPAVPLENFIQMKDYETVTILELNKAPIERSHGFTHGKLKTKDGYVTDVPLDVEFELLEKTFLITAIVQFKDGTKLEVPADRLNG